VDREGIPDDVVVVITSLSGNAYMGR